MLKRGSRGNDVQSLQARLLELGFLDGAVDGIFGPQTERAVRAFQQSARVQVDGVVGPITEGALASAEPGTGGGGGGDPGTGSTTDPWTAVSRDERMAHAMRFLVAQGYPENGAAGVVGNLDAESGVIPSRVEGSRSDTPMRAQDFSGATVDFTPEQIMNRDRQAGAGPRRPGVGLAQWTSGNRRAGLFAHSHGGQVLGAQILFDMDAQLDYLVSELRGSYRGVDTVLTAPDVTVADAAAEVVYRFEVPGSVLERGRLRPRTDPAVQEVFRARTERAERALEAFRRSPG